MAKGRKPVYQSDDEKPVMLSLRIQRDLADKLKRYAERHRQSITDVVIDGIQIRLETPADPRDLILSDDNTVLQEVQEMIRAAVQAEIGKLNTFMESASGALKLTPAPEAPPEPAPALLHDSNTAIQEVEGIPLVDPSGISYDDNTVIQKQAPKRPGRQSTVRQPIIDLLRQHPEGLTAVQIKVHLGIDKNIGDTLAGMVRQHHLDKKGSGQAVRYLAVGAQGKPTKEHGHAKRPAPRKAGVR
jgi:hypothetical protein